MCSDFFTVFHFSIKILAAKLQYKTHHVKGKIKNILTDFQ